MNAMPQPNSPELSLSVQTGDGVAELPVSRARLRRWVRNALQGGARITLRFVDRDEGLALNREHRGRDYATNVLTFAYGAPALPPGTDAPDEVSEPPWIEADIVLCLPVIDDEARAQGKPLDHHLAHLVTHGVLHAQGYDHEDDEGAAEMEALEAALLRRLRIPDPYAAERDRAT